MNGLWPTWLEGIYAHLQFEVEFMIMYMNWDPNNTTPDIYGDVNVFIPGGGLNGGIGYADVVLYNNGSAQIYEIKPESHHEDAIKREKGKQQLSNYISYHTYFLGQAYYGEEVYVEPILYMETPFIFDESRNIIYRMYEDAPGMIYYDIVEKGENETEELPVMSKEEKFIFDILKDSIEMSIWRNPEIIAGMIEDPDSSDTFSSIFTPEAILKSFLKNFMQPFGSMGGVPICCPI